MTISGTVKPHPEWRIVVDLMRNLQYGEQIAHRDVARATDLRYESRAYWSAIRQAKKVLLRDYDIEIETMRGQGYRRVEPSGYRDRGLREVRLGNRRYRRGARVIVAAPQQLLSDAENKANADTLAKLGSLLAMARRTLREAAKLLPPTKPDLPRLMPGEAAEENETKH